MPLRTQLTIATRVGDWPEVILTLLGLGLALAAGLRTRRSGRRANGAYSGFPNAHEEDKNGIAATQTKGK